MANTTFSSGGNAGLQQGQNYGVNVNQFISQSSSSSEATKCHQLFQLAEGKESYEFYKDRIVNRVSGTCEWFLKHPTYLAWKQQDFGTLLVSADPGCGKSVLAKHMVQHELHGIVCYFFFRDKNQNTFKQALCAVLHQLFAQQPSLLKYAVPKYKQNGVKLINFVGSLWTILLEAARNAEASVTIVLDALDECDATELKNLSQKVVGHASSNAGPKFLLTCRPYQAVLVEFWQLLPKIHIPGEDASAEIEREVNLVIEHRVNEISQKFGVSKSLKQQIKERVTQTPHRTYLWVYLVFEELDKGFRKTPKSIESAISRLPKTLNQAYERILEKSSDPEKARKALKVILAAARPLTLHEMNIALHIEDGSTDLRDIELEADADFKNDLRNLCGLFISVYNDKVDFLHQTAREFLLAGILSPSRWCASILIGEAHAMLAHICLLYLNLEDFNLSNDDIIRGIKSGESNGLLCYATNHWAKHFREAAHSLDQSTSKLAAQACNPVKMTRYPKFWVHDLFTLESPYAVLRDISPLMVASYLGLENVIRYHMISDDPNYDDEGVSALHLASDQGHIEAVRALLDRGADINGALTYCWTPLEIAIKEGRNLVVRLLLDRGADLSKPKLYCSETPSSKMLANFKAAKRSSIGGSILHHAASFGNRAAVHILLSRGMDINEPDYGGETILSKALSKGNAGMAKLLIKEGADVHWYGHYGTALHYAIKHSVDQEVVCLLLGMGVEVNRLGPAGETALHEASIRSEHEIVRMLIDAGADIDLQTKEGKTALHVASYWVNAAAVHPLLQKGADLNIRDKDGITALHYTSDYHWSMIWNSLHQNADNLILVHARLFSSIKRTIVSMLLKHGADANVQDKDGCTALHWALHFEGKSPAYSHDYDGFSTILSNLNSNAEFLSSIQSDESSEEKRELEHSFSQYIEHCEEADDPILMVLAGPNEHNHLRLVLRSTVMQIIDQACLLQDELREGIRSGEVVMRGLQQREIEVSASSDGNESLVKLLLDGGAQINLPDKRGYTALDHARENGHKEVIEVLLERGAEESGGHGIPTLC